MSQKDHTDPDQLEALRRKIDEIDQQIVDLLSERQAQVTRIVDIKKRHHLPVYHPAREEDLISSRRQQARRSELDPDFVEELYRIIMRRSRIEQSDRMAKKAVKPGATVLIVGGYGEMGQYFAECYRAAGYYVRLLGRDDWPQVESLCAGVELAVVSVPIEKTVETIDALAPYLPAEAVLADLTSIKKAPLEAMQRAHRGPVIGLHPLFGPTTSSLDKQIIVATPGRDNAAAQWVLDQFTAWGAVIVTSSADEHDEIMAIVQSLRHFATFAFGQFLARKKTPIARTLEFSSPIYRLELGMVGRLFAQDPALYAEIIFASRQRIDLLRQYIENVQQNLEMVKNGDKSRFIAEFNKIADWFGPFSEQAIRESSFLIDKLIERF
ncbi:MAG: bifunctional chorismate mutase/prephenate dehydrogenase [Thermodesulfobacteriota bacterium]